MIGIVVRSPVAEWAEQVTVLPTEAEPSLIALVVPGHRDASPNIEVVLGAAIVEEVVAVTFEPLGVGFAKALSVTVVTAEGTITATCPEGM